MKVHVHRRHGNLPLDQTKRLKRLNPGLGEVSDKISAKDLILRQMVEIVAFGAINTLSLDPGCQLSSIDSTPLNIGFIGIEWAWVVWVGTLWLRSCTPSKAPAAAILGVFAVFELVRVVSIMHAYLEIN